MAVEINWPGDEREIMTVILAAMPDTVFSSLAGSSFERITHNGEYCDLPWIRIKSPTGSIIEAPLTHVQMLTFKEPSNV